MSNPSTPVIRKPAQGRTVAVVGDVYRFLATGEDTNGKYALWEALVSPGGGPPPHVHSREEEGFFVLEGDITLQIGEGVACRHDLTGRLVSSAYLAAFAARLGPSCPTCRPLPSRTRPRICR
jgi:hypothetical protein